ncbi:unnamed protein product [Parascedosporium putredinis]|uniref:Uncharacterized protein n=1 Tax=Parascedosporium putredinis TaxID=1442378 RepID=A0A9P1MB12_9PEZI|nr:unnamed protein product [Parascedosporium putredinis]CAI7993719.1 unnamed protein product [Parascedosporium putredinis]
MDVRVKLRKFERLESTYTELLRSYRIAHSRETVDNDSTRFEADTSHSSGGPWSTDGAKVRSSSELFSFDAEIRDDSRARTQEIETLKRKYSRFDANYLSRRRQART